MRYYLPPPRLNARPSPRAVPPHGGIETRLHWVLDVVFRDDLCRLRTGHGPHNMAVIRHMAMNLVRTASGRHSLKVRPKRAAWNVDHLHALLRQTA